MLVLPAPARSGQPGGSGTAASRSAAELTPGRGQQLSVIQRRAPVSVEAVVTKVADAGTAGGAPGVPDLATATGLLRELAVPLDAFIVDHDQLVAPGVPWKGPGGFYAVWPLWPFFTFGFVRSAAKAPAAWPQFCRPTSDYGL